MKPKNKHTTIGLIVDDIFSDFAKEVIHSTMNALPNTRDYRLVVIAGKYVDERAYEAFDYSYKKTYNSVYKLGDICDIDGLIISLGSIDPSEPGFFFKKYNADFENIPKVIIAGEVEGYLTVNYDNSTGIREAIDYLVNVNGFSKICMLGGRDDNGDAMKRKKIYLDCLKEHFIDFKDEWYIPTGMDPNCVEQASRLLDNNPDVQAIFCVNDAVAIGLYEAMSQRSLVPGKDIMVFGFDNTVQAGNMKPSLASIGADNVTLGRKAVELLLKIFNGEEVHSELLPVKVYGRESFDCSKNDFAPLHLFHADDAFLYKLFDDCFYRYKNELIDPKDVDLKRLFYEFAFRMLRAMRMKYMSLEEFQEVERLIDIFFENGAMDYTDTSKLINTINRLQRRLNIMQKSAAASYMNNRLFTHIKDSALRAVSAKRDEENSINQLNLALLLKFQIDGATNARFKGDLINRIIRNFDKLGLHNAAFYMYDKPVDFSFTNPPDPSTFPTTIDLICLTKNGTFHLIPEERRATPVNKMFARDELSAKKNSFLLFPVFYESFIFGLLISEIDKSIYDRGEFIAGQLGRSLNDARLSGDLTS